MKKCYIILILTYILNATSFAQNCEKFNSTSAVDVYVHSYDVNAICNGYRDTILNYNVEGCIFSQNDKYITPKVVKELLKMGANPNKIDRMGDTPLTTLLFSGCNDLGTEQILLEAGANPNKPNGNGDTPLMLLLGKPNAIELMNLILDKKATINAQDKNGRTVLMQASNTSTINTSIIDLLISKGARINIKDKEGKTAIFLAAQHSRSDVIEKLFKHGASLTVTDNKKNSIIVDAIKEGARSYTIHWLVEKGAPINKQNSSGMTPLMVAAYKGDLATVKILLIDGAITNLKAINGATAESFARASNNIEIANYIRNYSAKVMNDKIFNNML